MGPFKLKGAIHELGHAFGLPHIGPKPSDMMGNTLMGPINKAFEKQSHKNKADTRVYLSEASAAMLTKHPIFNASFNKESINNRDHHINVSNLSFKELPEKRFKISGRIHSKTLPDSAIILDSPKGYGDYWARPYRSEVYSNGEFSITVTDPFDNYKGVLNLFFCMDNGLVTANGKPRTLIVINYKGHPGKRIFKQQALIKP